jgi:predicted LPLAT superfamily acyltransferase
MEYFEVTRSIGAAVCSDPNCPCNEVVIPPGTGYVYISPGVVRFRNDCRTHQEVELKVRKLRSQRTFVVPQNLAVPVLVCEQGATLRGIDLEVAAADAKHWWKTGLLPLRATPRKPTRRTATKGLTPAKQLWIKVFFMKKLWSKRKLIVAVNNNDVQRVKALIAAKADVSAKTKDGWTTLILASQRGHTEIVRTLLDAKADVNAKGSNGDTALIVASWKGHTEIVRMLIDAKADVNAKNNNSTTALLVATSNGHAGIVRMLIEAKADVNAKYNTGTTALMEAADPVGKTDLVRMLIEAKADVNAKENLGVTALMLASSELKGSFEGRPDIVRMLIERKTEVVRMLIEAKADVNAMDFYGRTALKWATSSGHTEIVRMLKEAGAK